MLAHLDASESQGRNANLTTPNRCQFEFIRLLIFLLLTVTARLLQRRQLGLQAHKYAAESLYCSGCEISSCVTAYMLG